jgi:hypothetical protein
MCLSTEYQFVISLNQVAAFFFMSKSYLSTSYSSQAEQNIPEFLQSAAGMCGFSFGSGGVVADIRNTVSLHHAFVLCISCSCCNNVVRLCR